MTVRPRCPVGFFNFFGECVRTFPSPSLETDADVPGPPPVQLTFESLERVDILPSFRSHFHQRRSLGTCFSW